MKANSTDFTGNVKVISITEFDQEQIIPNGNTILKRMVCITMRTPQYNRELRTFTGIGTSFAQAVREAGEGATIKISGRLPEQRNEPSYGGLYFKITHCKLGRFAYKEKIAAAKAAKQAKINAKLGL